MRAGQLRHRVDIEQPTSTKSADTGAVQDGWITVDTVWASVEPLRGRELIEAAQVQSNVTHRVRMRHRSDVTPSNRLDHNGRKLNIESVIDPSERDIMLELMCTEVA